MNLSRQYTVVGRERQVRHENDTASASAHYDPAHYYDQPRELRRTNRHGVEVVTYHHSQGSYDYTAAEVI